MRSVGLAAAVLVVLLIAQYPSVADKTPPAELWNPSPRPTEFAGSSTQYNVAPEQVVQNLYFQMEDRDTRQSPTPEIQDEDYVWDWFDMEISNGGTVTFTDYYGWDCHFDFEAPDYAGSWSSRVTVNCANTNTTAEGRLDLDEYFSVWFCSFPPP